jgi:hypothetical protein
MPNINLQLAKTAKSDEFYTQYQDIQKEVEKYLDYNPDVFRGKTIYCNCDDPFESNFFKYFANRFKSYGIKKLITTSYFGSPITQTQLRLPGVGEFSNKKERPEQKNKKAFKLEINEVSDLTKDGITNLNDVMYLLKHDKNASLLLHGDDKYTAGDFRSKECIELLKKADIVVTNPPFSLFREYIKQLVDYDKKFLIIGNMNAITYKEVFPLIKSNKVWLGPSITSGDREFQVPDDYPLNAAGWRIDEKGRKYLRIKGIRWFTNLDHGRRHQPLQLMTMAEIFKYHKKMKGKHSYEQYDNYDAIEVPFTDAIPSDYGGVMGVPITFLDKYNPGQFEILGATQRGCHNEVPDTKKYNDYWEVRQNGQKTGSSGGKTNENANLVGNDGKKNYFINKEGRVIQSAYQRIFIRHRKKQNENIFKN